MSKLPKIGVVVLTYNHAIDLPYCIEDLLKQEGVELRLIVVDNASRPAARDQMESIFRSLSKTGEVVERDEADPSVFARTNSVFIRNTVNSGYSAGNNVGLRFAVSAGCIGVMIVNPDVRMSNTRYLAMLWKEMSAVSDCVVSSSRLINIDGKDEHPMREPTFWEELLWIRQFGPQWCRTASYVIPPDGNMPVEAAKLHGACLLFQSKFLVAMGFLDENVFLYCEEPIIASKVRAAGKRMMVFPKLDAVHAHIASTKGNPSRRMLQFIHSRRYYTKNYSGYGAPGQLALGISYGLLALVHRARAKFSDL